ncbi:NUP-domain-containing protein [Aureobasidium pullulans]|uniref:NUP-domain-containing protein n=1 Tax=Aureobasidium pullulans TaxID=5580 RepID=A0AB74JYL9_AURPU|nr:NUP-domain-containing protein [Aureobasidium pullulans]THX56201.1 NUP-domain-containing protein [Aureobasidium pullulans]
MTRLLRNTFGHTLVTLTLLFVFFGPGRAYKSNLTWTTTNSSICASSTTGALGPVMATASFGTSSKPKVLIIGNKFEFTYLSGLNFTTSCTGPLLTSLYACKETGEICKLECGQELVSAQQITALALVPGIDLTATYVIITGTGGVNPKYGTAGGVAISQYSIQLEWLSMFLGSDLPANFSSQYMYAYAQASPFGYPSLVGSEVYELDSALIDRIAAVSTDLEFEDVDSDLQRLRQTYLFEAARKAPFLAHCDVVSSQIYWHGDVAGHNVEVYANIVTSGAAKPCNTNQDDQGRLLGLAGAAEAGLLDFSRVAMIKAFSNFDRPPPQLSAYQSRYYVGEAATGPGLRNAWSVIRGVVADVLEHWEDVYEDGISAPNYVGDAKGTLGGTPPFVQNSTAVAGSVQGA